MSRPPPDLEKARMTVERAPTWKLLAAFVLDLCTVALVAGYAVAAVTGDIDGAKFHLHGAPAMAAFILVLLYFVAARFVGGSLWDRVFRIARPQPRHGAVRGELARQVAGDRAGVLRRMLAIAIDTIVVTLLFQLAVAALFVATSGRVQMLGGLTWTTCTIRAPVPDGLMPPPPQGANLARECNVTLFGAPTARFVQVGRGNSEQTLTKAGSRIYLLDQSGRLGDAVAVDWIWFFALLAYLIALEARSGATLGNRALGIRVVDVAAPATAGLPPRKAALRYLAMAIGFVPVLLACLIDLALYGSPAAAWLLLHDLSLAAVANPDGGAGSTFHWSPAWFILSLRPESTPASDRPDWLFDLADLIQRGWVVFLFVQVFRELDPLYDMLAGTAVLRAPRNPIR